MSSKDKKNSNLDNVNNLAKQKKRAILFLGYHYLSTPIYEALKHQLKDFDLFYVFTKDTIGSNTNYKHFDNQAFKDSDPNYFELGYDPPWHRGIMLRDINPIIKKRILWLKWMFSFSRFKREVLNFVLGLNPDIILTTTDLFFTPRFIADKLPHIPIALIQPCFLDLWEREPRYFLSKRIVNFLQPYVFEKQQYFGFEIKREELLIWEPSPYEIYKNKGKNPIKIINPTHLYIKNISEKYRNEERKSILDSFGYNSNGKKTISFFTAYYADVKGHGLKYQTNLEDSLVYTIKNLTQIYNIIIKVHPNEEMSYWKNVFREFSDNEVRIIHKCDKFKLMAVSDYMISTNSYAAVEATLAGAVTINFVPGVNIISKNFCIPFNRNAVLIEYDKENLCKQLKEDNNLNKSYQTKITNVQNVIMGVCDETKAKTVEEVMNDMIK